MITPSDTQSETASVIRSRLTYANVTATVALILALASFAMRLRNLLNDKSSLAPAGTAGTTWYIGGSEGELPECTRCEVSLPASGSGFIGSTENSSNEQLSPNVTVVARNLCVHVDTAPGGNRTRSFFLFSHDNPSQSLRCDVTGTNNTGDSGNQTLTIAPRTRLFIDAVNLGNAPATKVQFSWSATAP